MEVVNMGKIQRMQQETVIKYHYLCVNLSVIPNRAWEKKVVAENLYKEISVSVPYRNPYNSLHPQ